MSTTVPSGNFLKIWRTPFSRFGISVEQPDDLMDETILAEKAYTDGELSDIAALGFNAIWIHGRLEHLIANARFPEFAPHQDLHLAAIRRLCERAGRYGIAVYLYLQPPRAVAISETAFWEKHPDAGGQELETCGDDGKSFRVRCFCTSVESVRAYLKEAFASLTRLLPELGGYLIITASEYPAHCYSRRNCRPGVPRPRKQKLDHVPTDCPRCSLREPEDVVVELIQTIRDGVRSVSREKNLIFWNWSWTMYLDSPCESILSRLPADTILLADFERGGIRPDGLYNDEYSLGYPGPSEQFLEMSRCVGKRGIPILAKFQLGTTHELATVRNIPVPGNLFLKARALKQCGCAGFLGCWNFGNLPSENLEAFRFFLEMDDSVTDTREALKLLAGKRYPSADPEACAEAWELFGEAMNHYPFIVPFLYHSPMNYTLSLIPRPGPVGEMPVGRSWLPDERGESLAESITETIPLDRIIERLEKMSELWNRGLAVPGGPSDGSAAICGCVWRSAANMYKIYRLRLDWNHSKLPEYRNLIRNEISVLEDVLPHVDADPLQGWHIEGDFQAFSGKSIRAKRDVLLTQLNEFESALSAENINQN